MAGKGIVRKPICPNCDAPLTRTIQIYGQKSYDCSSCNSWGPWKNRKTVRVVNE